MNIDTGLHFALVFSPNRRLDKYQADHYLPPRVQNLATFLRARNQIDQIRSSGMPVLALYRELDTHPGQLERPPTPSEAALIAASFFRNDNTFLNGATIYARNRQCPGGTEARPRRASPIVYPSGGAHAPCTDDPIAAMLALSASCAPAGTASTQGPRNIASVAVFAHGIPDSLQLPLPNSGRGDGWSGPDVLARALAGHLRPSCDILLYACLTAHGSNSYAERLATQLRASCPERIRVFGHETATHYASNPNGREFVSERGGPVVSRSNREVCLPDAWLRDPAEVERVAQRVGRSSLDVASVMVRAADQWMHGAGARVRVGGPAMYTIGYRRDEVIARVQAAWRGGADVTAVQAQLGRPAPPHRATHP